MYKSCIAAAFLAFALIPSLTSAQNCATTDADKSAVADTLRMFYAAATVDDLVKLHAITAPTFYAFDGGQRFSSIDELLKEVKLYQDQGVKFVWTVTHPDVTIHCSQAWITYLNDGSIQIPNSAKPAPTQWLESAILEKQAGTWKIVFFHSTQVPPPTAPTK
jgi:hypothetical protein